MSVTKAAETQPPELKRVAEAAISMGQTIAKHGKALAGTRGSVGAEQVLQTLRSDLAQLGAIARDVDQVLPDISAAATKEFGELESVLRSGCVERGWRCDGQWPRFVVAAGIDVDVQEKSRTVRVGRTKLSGLDANSIFAELEGLVRQLVPTGFDSCEFLERLFEAYEAARKASGPVQLLRVYREYVVASQKGTFWNDAEATSFIGVSASQFRARLSALLESGRLTTKEGQSLRLVPPLDPKDALFIYLPAERRFGFVGRIEFVPET